MRNYLVEEGAFVRTAYVADHAHVGEYSVVEAGARLAERCEVGLHCYVDGGSTLGVGVTLCPGARCIRSALGKNARLSYNAVAIDATIGKGAVIDAGAVARGKIPARAWVRGESQIIGWRCDCGALIEKGHPNKTHYECPDCQVNWDRAGDTIQRV